MVRATLKECVHMLGLLISHKALKPDDHDQVVKTLNKARGVLARMSTNDTLITCENCHRVTCEVDARYDRWHCTSCGHKLERVET